MAKKLTKNQKIIGALALVLGAYLITPGKAKSASKDSPLIDPQYYPKSGHAYIIYDLDTLWNYKLEGGVWYTQRKNALDWIPMKENLTAANYAQALSILNNYLTTHNITL